MPTEVTPVMPNLPAGKIVAALADFRLPKTICNALRAYGVEPLFTRPVGTLPDSLCGHPDLQICHTDRGSAVCVPGLGAYYDELFAAYGVSVTEGNLLPGGTYPSDTAYNVARMGEMTVCNHRTAEPLATRYGRIIDVRQGYVKCNLCIVDENSVITSDTGIAKVLLSCGIDVLTISCGHIALPGYSYGFIGGTSGLIAPDTLAFFGRVDLHPDFVQIEGFCRQRGVFPVLLGDGPLTDYGSLLPIAEPA